MSKISIPKETRQASHHQTQATAKARQQAILSILTECGPMTAREIAVELYRRGIAPTPERNHAAPRLTELQKAGKAEAVMKKPCTLTGRMVSVWKLTEQ